MDEEYLLLKLNQFRVEDLKDILRIYGERVSGRKAELVGRLFYVVKTDSTSEFDDGVLGFKVETNADVDRMYSKFDELAQEAQKKRQEELFNRIDSMYALDFPIRHTSSTPPSSHSSLSSSPPPIDPLTALNVFSMPIQKKDFIPFTFAPFYQSTEKIVHPKVLDCRWSGFSRIEFRIEPDKLELFKSTPTVKCVLAIAPIDQTKLNSEYFVEYPIFYQGNNVSHFSMRANEQDVPVSRFTGMKKKQGTATPTDLTPYLVQGLNIIEVRFTSHSRRYYYTIHQVSVVPIEDLIKDVPELPKASVVADRKFIYWNNDRIIESDTR
jgi:hypothetical protein